MLECSDKILLHDFLKTLHALAPTLLLLARAILLCNYPYSLPLTPTTTYSLSLTPITKTTIFPHFPHYSTHPHSPITTHILYYTSSSLPKSLHMIWLRGVSFIEFLAILKGLFDLQHPPRLGLLSQPLFSFLVLLCSLQMILCCNVICLLLSLWDSHYVQVIYFKWQ